MIFWLGRCFCAVKELQKDLQSEGSSHTTAPVAAPTPILTSLLLAALATTNPSLMNTLLLTNPYLATYLVPHIPTRYPIYGYSPVNSILDSSAYGNPYKRETFQK